MPCAACLGRDHGVQPVPASLAGARCARGLSMGILHPPSGAGPHTGAGTGNSAPEGPGRGGGSAICAVSPAKRAAGPGRHLGSRRVTSPPLPSVRPPGRGGHMAAGTPALPGTGAGRRMRRAAAGREEGAGAGPLPAGGGRGGGGCASGPGGSAARLTCPGGSPAHGRSAPPCKSSGICRPGPCRRAAAGSGSGSQAAARAGLPARRPCLPRAPWPERRRRRRRSSRVRPRCRRQRLPQRRRRLRRCSSPSPPAPCLRRHRLLARRGHRRLPLPSPSGPGHGEAAGAAAGAALQAAHPPALREHPALPLLQRRLQAPAARRSPSARGAAPAAAESREGPCTAGTGEKGGGGEGRAACFPLPATGRVCGGGGRRPAVPLPLRSLCSALPPPSPRTAGPAPPPSRGQRGRRAHAPPRPPRVAPGKSGQGGPEHLLKAPGAVGLPHRRHGCSHGAAPPPSWESVSQHHSISWVGKDLRHRRVQPMSESSPCQLHRGINCILSFPTQLQRR